MCSVCTIRSHVIDFNPFWIHLLVFMHLLIFWAKWPWNWKTLQITIRKGWKLAWYHHFTHIACAKKLWGLRQKLDALRLQNGESPSKYLGLGRKLIDYKGFSFFKHILTHDFFCIKYATFKATSSLFTPFVTSFAIFHAFHDLFWAKMTLKLKSTANGLWNGWKLAWYNNFTHIACAK